MSAGNFEPAPASMSEPSAVETDAGREEEQGTSGLQVENATQRQQSMIESPQLSRTDANEQTSVIPEGQSRKSQFLLTTNQWLSVSAALAALAVAVYYGCTQLRLQQWQVKNDFYWQCLQAYQSNYTDTPSSCRKALEDPPDSPVLLRRDVPSVSTAVEAMIPALIALARLAIALWTDFRVHLFASSATHLIGVVLSALLLQSISYGIDYPLVGFVSYESPSGGQGYFSRWPVYATSLFVWMTLNGISAFVMGFNIIVPTLTFTGIVQFAKTFRLRKQQRRYDIGDQAAEGPGRAFSSAVLREGSGRRNRRKKQRGASDSRLKPT